ncbi:MAG: AAA family ATPase [Clostridia bacterium]|nr:AAA family ATPase [Clostridia bacterium]
MGLTGESGILVMGLNGCGKSTVGKALAEKIGWRFMDAEDFYFPPGQPVPYAVSRTRAEALGLLREAVKRHPRFVYASVSGPRDDEIEARCALAVVLRAPKDVRLRRIEERETARFGDRAREGGDLYERQQAFRAFVSARTEADVEAHAARLNCPVLRLDATRPVEENVERVVSALRGMGIG